MLVPEFLRTRFVCLICLAFLATLGCGGDGRPSLVPVTGTVLLNDEPIEGAQLTFTPDNHKGGYGRPSSAVTDASGQFSPWTYAPGDGLPPGKYVVTITKQQPETLRGEPLDEEMVGSSPYQIRWLIPQVYSEIESSGLAAEVTRSGLEPSEFRLEGTSRVERVQ